MKKLLLSSLLLTTAITMTTPEDDLKSQLTQAENSSKQYQAELDTYNQALPLMNGSKQKVAQAQSTITNLTNKLEALTGIITSANGSISYNNIATSNDALTKANTKLKEDLATNNAILQTDLAKEQAVYNDLTTYIAASRTTLGTLRSAPVTDDITNKQIPFYQNKITNEYLPQQVAAQTAITNDNNKITQNNTTTTAKIVQNNNTITANTAQIAIYQGQIDAAKKDLADNQKVIDDWTAKLNATPDKINFNNISIIQNKINDTTNQITNLNNQIANPPKVTPAK